MKKIEEKHFWAIATVAFGLFLNSFVFLKMWNWFGAKLFETQNITYWHSFGIWVMFMLVTNQIRPIKFEVSENWKIEDLWFDVTALYFLLIGWIAHLLI
ncbi:MAG: hypothetical protein KBD26_00875 [Candidatus Pacebacteria bacterium]|nr:hypothetical protein [Candidatus Paceibacterota bacterium]MBP9772364.1 hypothetical protein [Candidatus Paceibacterota bacterium]